MFDPFVLERNDPIYKEVMEKQMPLNPDGSEPITEKWFTGVRSTQLIYLRNPITSYESGAFTPREMREIIQRNFIRGQYVEQWVQDGLHDFVMDNVFWTGWNTRQHMGAPWQGITRFEVTASG